MILPALIDYYERLKADPEQEVAPFGFSSEKISFCIVLNPDGTLADAEELEDVRREEEGKRRPRSMIVPERGGRRTSQKVQPNFLWDNTGYVLGRDRTGITPFTRRKFEAFRELHRELSDRVKDPGLDAVCRFLNGWTPEKAQSFSNFEEVCGANLVFRLLRGRKYAYVHESQGLQDIWQQYARGDSDVQKGRSLISGAVEDIAGLHTKIKNAAVGQDSQGLLVSFNRDAFKSYGKEQSYNAPVGAYDAFRYATALNHLLEDDRHCVRIGDTTAVFWADRPTPFEDFFGGVVADVSLEDTKTTDRLRDFLERYRQGRLDDALEDADVPFYVLGLSLPSKSRICVRFWMTGTIGQFVEKLNRHAQDLQIVGGGSRAAVITVDRIVRDTSRQPDERKPEDVSPLLASEVARAILNGTPYPQSLFTSIIRRNRLGADSKYQASVDHRRTAILKACLTRQARVAGQQLEVPVSLNPEHSDPAYQLGRLFAVLEKIQEDVPGERVKSTIKDRYFGAASATPATVFSTLMRLSQHHLAKLGKQRMGLKVTHEKRLQEICSRIDAFPPYLPLNSQGLFQIAYYQQRQAFFQSNDAAGKTAEIESAD